MLHSAVVAGNLDIVKLLIENGAGLSLKVSDGKMKGKSALDLAEENGHDEIVKLLKAVKTKK